MNITDPIADMLARIQNANAAGLEKVEMPHSRLKEQIARVFQQEGYLANYGMRQEGTRKYLDVQLKILGKQRAITGVRRISKPGVRRYVKTGEIPRVLGGMGTVVLSTSRGVMTGREAKQSKLGGEVLCYVW